MEQQRYGWDTWEEMFVDNDTLAEMTNNDVIERLNSLETALQQAQQRVEAVQKRVIDWRASSSMQVMQVLDSLQEILGEPDWATLMKGAELEGKLRTAEATIEQLRAEQQRILSAWPWEGEDLGGKSLEELIAAEMHDYKMIINHCTEIYGWASGWRISKPNTLPSEVIAVGEDYRQDLIHEAVKEETDTLHRLAAGLATALKALDSLYGGFAEVVRTEDWGDAWYESAIPEVREAFTLAATVLADYAAWEQHEKGVANASQTPRT